MLGGLALLAGTLGLAGRQPSTAVAGSVATPTAESTAPGSASAGVPGWAPTTPSPSLVLPSASRPGLIPTTLDVPAIGVHSSLLALAVDADGVLVAPDRYDVAGWFTGGPVPGETGPAVIAGHVDSRSRPGVFFRLAQLRAGDEITVRRSDGSAATFTVSRVESYPKDEFPTERVYGPTPGHELRLITCGGDFDDGRQSYEDNIVVYAVLDSMTT